MTSKEETNEDIPPIPEGWTRCHAYLPRKHRYCRQLPLQDAHYCGNHRSFLLDESSKTRIPCPLDPTHSIYEDQLSRHLKICPKVRLQREQEEQPYYRHNVNCGGHGSTEGYSSSSTPQQQSTPLEQAKALARRVLEVHQKLFAQKDTTDVSQLSLQEIESALPLKDLSAPQLAEGLAEAIESYHIRSGGPKHVQQQASLLGHLKTHAPPTSSPLTMLELGAGRGMLGLVAAGAFAKENTAVDLVMVERAGTRSKADTILRNHQSTLEGRCLHIEKVRNWNRIQCDLAHVHMPTVLPSSKFVLVIAKHLCGAGTDLALQALYPVRDQIQVCLMATCCHGVCTWEHYVGRDYLVEVLTGVDKFGPDEFELLRLWSSGTVKDVAQAANGSPKCKKCKTTDEEETHKVGTDVSNNKNAISAKAVASALDLTCGVQGLGRACQRLLDYGRQQYMERVLFSKDDNSTHVELCYYVPSSVTPQNAVLIASRRGKTAENCNG